MTGNCIAEDYEKRWEEYLDHTHIRFLEELETSADDIILDPSCGTGLLAKRMIESDLPFSKLVLNDLNPGMQRKASERFKDHPHISFTQQPVQQLDFEANSFTKILCLNAFHNYSEQQKVIKRFWDIIQPGGHLYLLDWNNSGLFRPINWMIKQWAPEFINTKSLQKVLEMLDNSGFEIQDKKEWYYRYWKFCFVRASKSDL